MAKVQRLPVGRKPGQRKFELPEQVQVSLADLADRTRQGLLAFAVGVGMEVFRTLLEEDVTALVGPKGRHDPDRVAYRHSVERSSVVLGGRRAGVDRQRVRSMAGEELTLPTWAAFSGEDILQEMATERMLAGLSSRRYEVGLEPVGEVEGSGTSKSAVSRRFIARTRTALGELMARDLSELSLCAIFGDGLSLAEHTIVAAIGIDHDGNKHVLGLKEGSTENAVVCTGLLTDLVGRGLDVSDGILLVLDGGKGWAKAVRDCFGDLALVHRCRLHKERNVIGYLPDHLHAEVRRRLRRAWGKTDPEQALGALGGRGPMARGTGTSERRRIGPGGDGGDAHHQPAGGAAQARRVAVLHQHRGVGVLRGTDGDGQREAVAAEEQDPDDREVVRRGAARRREAVPTGEGLQGDPVPGRRVEDACGKGVRGRF